MLIIVACVATTSWRLSDAAAAKGATKGPVAPTNIVAKAPNTPIPKNALFPGFDALNLGAHVAYNTNTPSTTCRTAVGNETTRLPPIAAPIMVPIRNGGITYFRMFLRMIAARPMLEPNCTTPWSGISTVGGNKDAMVAITNKPPPSPRDAAIKLPANDTEHINKKPRTSSPVPSKNKLII